MSPNMSAQLPSIDESTVVTVSILSLALIVAVLSFFLSPTQKHHGDELKITQVRCIDKTQYIYTNMLN
jgi:hypothetical protein